VPLHSLRSTAIIGLLFVGPALFAQTSPKSATATLTISATVVTSVRVEIPPQGKPQVVVANTSDPTSTFARVASKGQSAAAPASGVGRKRKLPSLDAEKPSSLVFNLPTNSDQSELTETVRSFCDKSGHSGVLKTLTRVAK